MTGENETLSGSDMILNPVTIDMENFFVKPEKNDTTRIAALISKCIVPISIGIIDVPEKIQKHVEETGQTSETILPAEAVEVYKIVLKIKHQLFGDSMKGDDSTDLFTYEAVQSSGKYINEFKQILGEFCGEVETVQSQVASEKSFYMSKTLGTEIDINLIQIAVQNYVHSLNVTASGLKGYKILSLVKIINEIGEIVDSESTMKFYGCSDKTTLMNKLGYRILPGQMALDNQMNKLTDLIFEIEGSEDGNRERLI
jgi:hypothetical protein